MAQEAPSEPASTSSRSEDPSVHLGRYRLLQKIARGGMAEVFLARSYGVHGFEKTVAIKRILARYGRDPQFVRMLVDEAKISVLLNHPNIAQVLELGEHEGDHFIVMEFVPGYSLAAMVKRIREAGEKMGALEAAFILVETLQGLHAAHTQREPSGRPANIIHRDVSPQNVLISRDGHVKVIDFGIARAKDRLEATEIGTIKGKLRYLAPEMIDPARFSSSGDFDHRVDIFAAGICLFELVAGRTLFAGSNDVEVYEAITQGPIPDLVSAGLMDEQLSAIMMRALERYPDKRYATAEEFADKLRAYLYRADPSFMYKCIGAMVRRFFAAELKALERIEQTPPEATADEGHEVVLTRSLQPSNTAARRRGEGPVDPARQTEQLSARDALAYSGDRRAPGLSSPSRKARPSSSRNRADRSGAERNSDSGRALAALAEPDEPTSFAEGAGRGATPGTSSFSPHMLVSDEMSDPLASSTSARTPTRDGAHSFSDRRRPKHRTVLYGVSAVAGIGLSLGVVVVLELARRTDPVRPAVPPKIVVVAPPLPTTATHDDVRLLVNARVDGALIRRIDVPSTAAPAPALFTVSATSDVKIEITAPGYEKRQQHVAIPRGAETVRVEASLDPTPVAINVHVTPDRATVRVDGKLWEQGMTVRPRTILEVEAQAPGFASLKKQVMAEVGGPLAITLELRPSNSRDGRDARDTPTLGKSVLILTSSPYWGRVSVDGQMLEETTPARIELKAGVHEVVVTHPPKGLERRFRINLKAGETTRRAITF